MNTLLLEYWKPVVGFEGRYEVSNLGHVNSLRSGNPVYSRRNKPGYIEIKLYKEGKIIGTLIHSLVAAAFVGERPPKHEVNHRDGVKANNRLSNLEYCTKSENAIHAFRLGLMKPVNRKLTDADAEFIRQTVGVLGCNKLSKRYGVNARVIKDIRNGRSYRLPS